MIRDASNDNRILRNTFAEVGHAAIVSEQFCSRAITDACTKADDECPSSGTQIVGNSYVTQNEGRPIRISRIPRRPSGPSCDPAGPTVERDNRAAR